jgi:oxaloacetate decarboxylase gamma subunit
MSELMVQAFDLALYGMGTVFIFLTALVILTASMSRVVTWMGEPEPTKLGRRISREAPTTGPSPTMLAAISAAVKQYRERH